MVIYIGDETALGLEPEVSREMEKHILNCSNDYLTKLNL